MAEKRDKLFDIEKQVYQRHLSLAEIGEEGQLKLLNSRVLVVGLGGLGSPAVFYLAAAGVGTIGLADGDRVELSNLQRQIIHGRNDVGKPKTVSAAEKLSLLNPDLELRPHFEVLTGENAVSIVTDYDFVIEATDNFESKFLVNDICLQLEKPFCHAGIAECYGQMMTVVPGRGPCLRCIFGNPPPVDTKPVNDPQGIFAPVPGVIGTLQATEALKYLLECGNLLIGKMLTWDAMTMTFRTIELPTNNRCRLCKGSTYHD